MYALKAVFVAIALLMTAQAAQAEESMLMHDKLVIENHKAIQAEKRSEAAASLSAQTAEQKNC